MVCYGRYRLHMFISYYCTSHVSHHASLHFELKPKFGMYKKASLCIWLCIVWVQTVGLGLLG